VPRGLARGVARGERRDARAHAGRGRGKRAPSVPWTRERTRSIEGRWERSRDRGRDSNLSSADRNLHGHVHGIAKVLSAP